MPPIARASRPAAKRPERPRSRPALAIALRVDGGEWPSQPVLRRIARAALDAAVALTPFDFAPQAEVSLVFTDDTAVRRLNARYGGKDSPTNVLSFPGDAGEAPLGPMLGDIVFAAETVRREAAAAGLTVRDHLSHLLVHGFLHLVGYDHEDDGEAALMEGLETAILARLGIADPYA